MVKGAQQRRTLNAGGSLRVEFANELRGRGVPREAVHAAAAPNPNPNPNFESNPNPRPNPNPSPNPSPNPNPNPNQVHAAAAPVEQALQEAADEGRRAALASSGAARREEARTKADPARPSRRTVALGKSLLPPEEITAARQAVHETLRAVRSLTLTLTLTLALALTVILTLTLTLTLTLARTLALTLRR